MSEDGDAPASWFLISESDGSVLRITSDLHIGESTEGGLTFNDDDSACRWLAFRFEADGVWLKANEDRVRLTTEAGGWLEQQPLLSGLVLAFPHNRALISRDGLTHPAPGTVITVEPLISHKFYVDLGKVAEALNISAPDLRPEIDHVTKASSKPRGKGFRLALMLALLSAVVLAALPGVLTELKRDLTLVYKAVAHLAGGTQPPTNSAVEISTSAALIDSTKTGDAQQSQLDELVAPSVETQVEHDLVSTREPNPPLTSNAQPAQPPAPDVPTPSLVVDSDISLEMMELQPNESTPKSRSSDIFDTQMQVEAESADLALEDAASRSQPLLPPPDEPVSDAANDSRIMNARLLMEADQITYPPGNNAVALLVPILADSPSHPEALSLLGECSDRLIRRARKLYAAGHNYEARNALEEVLVFNPENERANRLWSEWVKSK